jgi:hypothetical protein
LPIFLWFGALILSLAGNVTVRAADSVVGSWEAEMKQGKFSMRMVLKIEEDANGDLSASFSFPDRGAQNMPVNALLYNDPELLIEFDQFGGVFRGALDLEKETFKGAWESANSRGPRIANKMTFKRVVGEPDEPVKLDFEFVDGDPAIKGYWKTKLQVTPEIAMSLIFRIGSDPENQLKGFVDIPGQGAKDIPVSKIEFASPNLSLSLAGLGMSFEGKVLEDARTVEGSMKSFGNDMEVRFERLDSLEDPVGADLSYESPSGEKGTFGFWEGTLDVQGTELRLAFAVGIDPKGDYHGTMDSLDQAARGIPMSSLEISDGHVVFKWAAMGATYFGELGENGDVLEGKFEQGPLSVPLKMERRSGPPAWN